MEEQIKQEGKKVKNLTAIEIAIKEQQSHDKEFQSLAA